MKMEVKASNASYFNYPANDTCQWCLQLDLT